jgi:hypothetical protein
MSDMTPEYYAAMDRAGLTAGSILTNRKSMQTIIGEIRSNLVKELNKINERNDNA